MQIASFKSMTSTISSLWKCPLQIKHSVRNLFDNLRQFFQRIVEPFKVENHKKFLKLALILPRATERFSPNKWRKFSTFVWLFHVLGYMGLFSFSLGHSIFLGVPKPFWSGLLKISALWCLLDNLTESWCFVPYIFWVMHRFTQQIAHLHKLIPEVTEERFHWYLSIK